MKKLSLLFVLIALGFGAVIGQNMKPEEILAKHAESLGPKEKREALNTLMAIGLSEFETTSPAVKGGGRAIVVSNPKNLFFVISLNSREYPFDKIGYFDGKVNLPFVMAGSRSLLGAFINEHSKILSEGLFGGATSIRWPWFRDEALKMKLKGGGQKKINDRRVYVIDYDPGTGGTASFSMKLYFDAETFQHVRTEHRYELQSGTPKFGQQNNLASSIGTLTEDFADYKNVDGLMLPHRHRIEFVSNGGSGAYKSIWGVRVAEYRLNQPLEEGFFTFDPKPERPVQ
jgi:hypothetical protein